MLNINDPKLTAFALDELDDHERDAVAAEVSRSPELRREVAAIRDLSTRLHREFTSETSSHASAATEQTSQDTVSTLHRAHGSHAPRQLRRLLIPLAMAASVGLLVVTSYLVQLKFAQSRVADAIDAQRASGPPQLNEGESVTLNIGGGSFAVNYDRTSLDFIAAQRQPQSVESLRLAGQRGLHHDGNDDGSILPVKAAKAVVAETATMKTKSLTPQEIEALASTLTGPRLSVVADRPGLLRDLPRAYGAVASLDFGFEEVLPPARADVAWYMYRPTPFEDGIGAPTEAATGDRYDALPETPFALALTQPLSTFSIDVDTASYSNARRIIMQGRKPPREAIRVEEMINYFDYDYPPPTGAAPFAVHVEVNEAPWNADHRLARIGIKGRVIAPDQRPSANLVFLIDVSGSMQPENRLPILKQGLAMLVNELRPDDDVAMVVYAGASGLVLPATPGNQKAAIRSALDSLQSGGGTNGAAGIELAYQTALANYIEGGINRVILATDGDFNVGVTDRNELVGLVETNAKEGVFLTVLGVGMGNLKDSTLEQLADKGNGNYAYIDTLNEARKVLVDQLEGTLVTIAKDVKIQVEFNPAEVSAYRLIGYENRMLAAQDFNDDTKDAGEIGAGHTVTALYEIVPAGVEANVPAVDSLKYQSPAAPTAASVQGELLTVKLRYKHPDGDTSELFEMPMVDTKLTLDNASDDFAWAASVAAFGMLLRDSQYVSEYTYDDVAGLAASAVGEDAFGYRAEFIDLVNRVQAMTPPGR